MLRNGPAKQVAVPSIEDKNTVLIVDGTPQSDYAGRAIGFQLIDLQYRIKRVPNENRVQEAAGLLQKRLQRFLDQVGENTRSRDRLDRDLIPVRKHILQAARLAILGVVVDRMVVATGCLKGEEDRVGHGSAWQRKTLADLKIIEPALLGYHPMGAGIETGSRFAHLTTE